MSADGENDKRQKARTLAVLVRFLPFIRDSSSNAQFSGTAVLAFCQQSHGVSVFLLVANKYSREYGRSANAFAYHDPFFVDAAPMDPIILLKACAYI